MKHTTKNPNMSATYRYYADDGNCEVEIWAASAQEAAQEYVDDGDWPDDDSTWWCNIRVASADDVDADRNGAEWGRLKIAVHPREPDCNDDSDGHDWQ